MLQYVNSYSVIRQPLNPTLFQVRLSVVIGRFCCTVHCVAPHTEQVSLVGLTCFYVPHTMSWKMKKKTHTHTNLS